MLIASIGEVLAAARHATTTDMWRTQVIAPLRITVSELVGGIERRQRGLDAEQDEVRKGISGLLTSDWFAAVERCESLLEATARTLPSFWAELVSTHARRKEWPFGLVTAKDPPLVAELASRSLWLEQETISLDPRLPRALVDTLRSPAK